MTVTVEPGSRSCSRCRSRTESRSCYVDPDAAWAALEADGRRWQAWCGRDRVRHAVPRSRGAQPAHPAAAHLLAVGRAGRRADDVAARSARRRTQLGLPLHVAPRREHRRRSVPRRRQGAEARRFLAWLLHASRLDRPRLPVLLTLHGRHPRPERTLSDWAGYAGSRPVRFGNGAADQHQLDSLRLGPRRGVAAHCEPGTTSTPRPGAQWRGSPTMCATTGASPTPASGRSAATPRHHVHSKLMAWLALDRALRIAATRRAPARGVTTLARRTRRDRRGRSRARL